MQPKGDCLKLLEAAQREIERLLPWQALGRERNHYARELAQSRATEAELRAKVHDVRSLAANALECVRTGRQNMAEGWLRRALELAALDAAEQPARAEGE